MNDSLLTALVITCSAIVTSIWLFERYGRQVQEEQPEPKSKPKNEDRLEHKFTIDCYFPGKVVKTYLGNRIGDIEGSVISYTDVYGVTRTFSGTYEVEHH